MKGTAGANYLPATVASLVGQLQREDVPLASNDRACVFFISKLKWQTQIDLRGGGEGTF